MMNIKKLISASMVAVALSGCQREAVKPNVLFILVDDMQLMPLLHWGTEIPILRISID